MHSWDHANSEYVSYVRVDHKGAEFVGNKQIHLFTYRRSTLYTVLVQFLLSAMLVILFHAI